MTRFLLLAFVFSLSSLPTPIAPPVVVVKPSPKKLTARQQARLDAALFLRDGGGTVGDWDSEAFALTPFYKLTGKAYQAAWSAYRDEFRKYLANTALAA
jgi:hypothetical protein